MFSTEKLRHVTPMQGEMKYYLRKTIKCIPVGSFAPNAVI